MNVQLRVSLPWRAPRSMYCVTARQVVGQVRSQLETEDSGSMVGKDIREKRSHVHCMTTTTAYTQSSKNILAWLGSTLLFVIPVRLVGTVSICSNLFANFFFPQQADQLQEAQFIVPCRFSAKSAECKVSMHSIDASDLECDMNETK